MSTQLNRIASFLPGPARKNSDRCHERVACSPDRAQPPEAASREASVQDSLVQREQVFRSDVLSQGSQKRIPLHETLLDSSRRRCALRPDRWRGPRRLRRRDCAIVSRHYYGVCIRIFRRAPRDFQGWKSCSSPIWTFHRGGKQHEQLRRSGHLCSRAQRLERRFNHAARRSTGWRECGHRHIQSGRPVSAAGRQDCRGRSGPRLKPAEFRKPCFRKCNSRLWWASWNLQGREPCSSSVRVLQHGGHGYQRLG